jgi:hypothetical protein
MCVSAAHVWVNEGKFVEATAFNGHFMSLIASFPYYDIILLQGEECISVPLLLGVAYRWLNRSPRCSTMAWPLCGWASVDVPDESTTTL